MKLVPNTDNCLIKSDLDLLIQSYSLFELALSGKGKLWINRRISMRVKYLYESHGLERDYLLNWLYERFSSNKHYQKFDPEKSSLPTFIGHCTNYALIDLIRKYKSLKNLYEEVPINLSDNNYRTTGRIGYSLSNLERAGNDGVIEWTTPEDYYFAKELSGLITEFFDTKELMILFGLTDRATAVDPKNWTRC